MARIESYKDLIVWQRGMELAEGVYALTKAFPRQEEYRMTSQLIRASISIPANIAEGYMRSTRKDYAKFRKHRPRFSRRIRNALNARAAREARAGRSDSPFARDGRRSQPNAQYSAQPTFPKT